MWKRTNPAEEILSCLEAEKSLLMSGGFKALSEAPDRKMALLEAMRGSEPDPEILRMVREKAARNAELLQLAAKALRDVSARMRSLTEQRPAFQSYTAAGGQRKIGGSADQVSRKL
jgi:hypothetical protein